MRLLDAKTLKFKVFNETSLPPYVILSHTWRDGQEVSFQEMRWLQALEAMPEQLRDNSVNQQILAASLGMQIPVTEEDIKSRSGYQKIVNTARIALEQGHDYFWIDTACIDKSSSSELQESINSMYRWYKLARTCLAYLDDVDVETWEETAEWLKKFRKAIKRSRWITRGWTLQELIAPPSLGFYNCDWTYLCTKHNVLQVLCHVTKIPPEVLATGDLRSFCVANIMSWASDRSTTRVEDVAYCLLGLFDIQMPLLYGEGEAAFIRLQDEIMKKSGDDSILAWKAETGGPFTYRGMLARSPKEFRDGMGVSNYSPHNTMSHTSLGVRVTVSLGVHGHGIFIVLAQLQTQYRSDFHHRSFVCLLLKQLSKDERQYARVEAHTFQRQGSGALDRPQDIYVRQHLFLPRDFCAGLLREFVVTPTTDLTGGRHHRTCTVTSVWPKNEWNWDTNEMTISHTNRRSFKCILSLSCRDIIDDPHNIRLVAPDANHSCTCWSFLLLLRFDMSGEAHSMIVLPGVGAVLGETELVSTLKSHSKSLHKQPRNHVVKFTHSLDCSHLGRYGGVLVRVSPTLRNDKFLHSVELIMVSVERIDGYLKDFEELKMYP